MASNTHKSGGAGTNRPVGFDKPIGHLLVWVDAGVDFNLSFDEGANFFSLDPGNHQFPVGITKRLHVTSDGYWDLVGIQS